MTEGPTPQPDPHPATRPDRTAPANRSAPARRGPLSARRPALMRMTLPVLAMVLLIGGCGPLKFPELPTPVDTPPTEVRAVRLVESSDQAGRYRIIVHLSNPNDLPLPMAHAGYRLRVGERSADDSFVPAATIPAEGEMTIELPAVLPDGAPQGQYEVTGTVAMRPEGEIRRVLYQLGVPLPKAPFEGSGTVQVVSGAFEPSAEPAPEPESPDETGDDEDGAGDGDAEDTGSDTGNADQPEDAEADQDAAPPDEQ